MLASLFECFSNPIFWAPTVGSMLMCLVTALMGVIVFIRKESLIGEALSHAAYPGVVLAVMFFAAFFPTYENLYPLFVIIGAALFALIGFVCIHFLQNKLRVKPDAALCFVLSSFLGIGVVFASYLQMVEPIWYSQIQGFLYGQVATMTHLHVLLYSVLVVGVLGFIILFFPTIKVTSFDRSYAETTGISLRLVDMLITTLLILAIVIGIKSVGVVLMTGMLIAPAAAARQYTNRLSTMFIYSGFFGVISGFFGSYISLNVSSALAQEFQGLRLSLPTGPAILLFAIGICVFSLLFAPKRGIIRRAVRVLHFRNRCHLENALKRLWKSSNTGYKLRDLRMGDLTAKKLFVFTFLRLLTKGYIEKRNNLYYLTNKGVNEAIRIVRYHRLWEVYLYTYLGVKEGEVHQNAEEIEHILTPKLERELTELLDDPRKDPHEQPIPGGV